LCSSCACARAGTSERITHTLDRMCSSCTFFVRMCSLQKVNRRCSV
jgi:hypothetical protein